jgi:hypothetical protein
MVKDRFLHIVIPRSSPGSVGPSFANPFGESMITKAAWLLINLMLDMIIVVPVARAQLRDYLATVGFCYFLNPGTRS